VLWIAEFHASMIKEVRDTPDDYAAQFRSVLEINVRHKSDVALELIWLQSARTGLEHLHRLKSVTLARLAFHGRHAIGPL
jgi:hypothetical protein